MNNNQDIENNDIGIKEARYYSRRFSDFHFKTGNSKKFYRKLYQEDMTSSHLSGQIVIREIIKRRHDKRNYQSVDELLMDIELIAAESFNFYAEKLSSGRLKPVDLNDFTSLAI